METFDLATSNRMDMTKKYVLSNIDITPMSIKYRLIIKVALLCFSILIGLSSCSLNSSSEEPYLTPEIAINQLAELSPTEGAQFFVNNREQYPFLDTLYVDNIVPIVGQCSFDTINAVKKCVEKTPADDALSPYYNETREDYLAGLNQEIKENAISQKKAFVDYIVPAMQVEIDSLLEVDMSEVMSKYSGGFMNWRKLKFWFGTGSDDFEKIWNENIDNDKYTECVAKYINTYLDSLAVQRNNYYNDIIENGDFESETRISQATMDLLLAKKCVREVKKFTEKEKDEMTTSFLKDWVAPTILGAFSGGVGTVVSWAYDAGNFLYDVKVTLDDIKSQKLDSEEVIKYACMENIGFQIRQAYLKYYTERVFRNIDENSDKLYNIISENL
ncbi:hypothetical protein [Segatella copri]|uniref:Lipoprotein n=1 Tax=Segatella copri TaxID=165179 RepID=A0AAW4N4P4_9BACT|nr:hypothetical protein [Segatella copri]MBV3389043.1 hypothetical protein [Segatella copri]MBV3396828.1 hypothetical protein [Segatella copri]MBV3406442.1 hypothetical protein [Segatella copri]